MDIQVWDSSQGLIRPEEPGVEASVSVNLTTGGVGVVSLLAKGATEREARWNLMLQAREAMQALAALVPPLQMPFADILSLDLEGTLISNAVSVIPRPGLRTFLVKCLQGHPEVVIYSSCPTDRVRDILEGLERDQHIPTGFAAKTRIFHPGPGSRKDLTVIGDPERDGIMHVDDQDVAVPGQEAYHVRIPAFEHPYPDTDRVLIELAGNPAIYTPRPPYRGEVPV